MYQWGSHLFPVALLYLSRLQALPIRERSTHTERTTQTTRSLSHWKSSYVFTQPDGHDDDHRKEKPAIPSADVYAYATGGFAAVMATRAQQTPKVSDSAQLSPRSPVPAGPLRVVLQGIAAKLRVLSWLPI
ncbi:hypothetical protein EYF80_018805 [Liparis tanakae]|uniref:Secreted protein n=1 Tax=Liparis tanakae TaxID=230148 RepID=A0A4Z2HYQ5_9TELE|nr:hypothetical protein EYF80_018805 [Liparis tanakae]